MQSVAIRNINFNVPTQVLSSWFWIICTGLAWLTETLQIGSVATGRALNREQPKRVEHFILIDQYVHFQEWKVHMRGVISCQGLHSLSMMYVHTWLVTQRVFALYIVKVSLALLTCSTGESSATFLEASSSGWISETLPFWASFGLFFLVWGDSSFAVCSEGGAEGLKLCTNWDPVEGRESRTKNCRGFLRGTNKFVPEEVERPEFGSDSGSCLTVVELSAVLHTSQHFQ